MIKKILNFFKRKPKIVSYAPREPESEYIIVRVFSKIFIKPVKKVIIEPIDRLWFNLKYNVHWKFWTKEVHDYSNMERYIVVYPRLNNARLKFIYLLKYPFYRTYYYFIIIVENIYGLITYPWWLIRWLWWETKRAFLSLFIFILDLPTFPQRSYIYLSTIILSYFNNIIYLQQYLRKKSFKKQLIHYLLIFIFSYIFISTVDDAQWWSNIYSWLNEWWTPLFRISKFWLLCIFISYSIWWFLNLYFVGIYYVYKGARRNIWVMILGILDILWPSFTRNAVDIFGVECRYAVYLATAFWSVESNEWAIDKRKHDRFQPFTNQLFKWETAHYLEVMKEDPTDKLARKYYRMLRREERLFYKKEPF